MSFGAPSSRNSALGDTLPLIEKLESPELENGASA